MPSGSESEEDSKPLSQDFYLHFLNSIDISEHEELALLQSLFEVLMFQRLFSYKHYLRYLISTGTLQKTSLLANRHRKVLETLTVPLSNDLNDVLNRRRFALQGAK